MQCLPADREVCQGTLLSWSQYLPTWSVMTIRMRVTFLAEN
jgi:hypothetical protein